MQNKLFPANPYVFKNNILRIKKLKREFESFRVQIFVYIKAIRYSICDFIGFILVFSKNYVLNIYTELQVQILDLAITD